MNIGKKIGMFVGGVAVFLFCFVFVIAPFIYEYGEAKSQSISTTHCYMMEISMFLNEYYGNTGSYPKRGELVGLLGERINSLGCGVSPKVVDGLLLDTFDDVICHNRESKNKLVIYSLNVNFIDYDTVTSDYSGYELRLGLIKPLRVGEEAHCGPS